MHKGERAEKKIQIIDVDLDIYWPLVYFSFLSTRFGLTLGW